MRLVVPGDDDSDGCIVVDVQPQDGIAILKNLCANDAAAATVQLSDELAAQFAEAVELERVDVEGRLRDVQGMAAAVLDAPMTVEFQDAVEEVKGYTDETADSAKPEMDVPEDEEPVQTAIGMAVDSGYIFGADSNFDALPTKVDILAHAGEVGMDLLPGIDAATMHQRRVHLFVDDHGEAALFGDLHELPNYQLTDADYDVLRNVRPGMGFVIENNVSSGYTYVFVKQASETKVELEYQAVK